MPYDIRYEPDEDFDFYAGPTGRRDLAAIDRAAKKGRYPDRVNERDADVQIREARTPRGNSAAAELDAANAEIDRGLSVWQRAYFDEIAEKSI